MTEGPFCPIGLKLWQEWDRLCRQKYPRADRKAINMARGRYVMHRKWCRVCPELIEKLEE